MTEKDKGVNSKDLSRRDRKHNSDDNKVPVSRRVKHESKGRRPTAENGWRKEAYLRHFIGRNSSQDAVNAARAFCCGYNVEVANKRWMMDPWKVSQHSVCGPL